jgi:CHAT domain
MFATCSRRRSNRTSVQSEGSPARGSWRSGSYREDRFLRTCLRIVSRSLPRTLVMADPAYGQSTSRPPSNLASYRSSDLDRSGLVFTALAGTAGEAKALQEVLKLDAQQVLTGADATEEKLKGLHGPCILHVATHGFFLSDQRMAAAALRPVSFGVGTPVHAQKSVGAHTIDRW